jgi:predicted phosphoribosyltransferase
LPRTALKGRTVVVTDDGVATGFTMEAALWAAKQETPQRLIAAVSVAAASSLTRLAIYAEEVVCLRAPGLFWSVGQFYAHFGTVEDQDILRMLREETERRSRNVAGLLR